MESLFANEKTESTVIMLSLAVWEYTREKEWTREVPSSNLD